MGVSAIGEAEALVQVGGPNDVHVVHQQAAVRAAIPLVSHQELQGVGARVSDDRVERLEAGKAGDAVSGGAKGAPVRGSRARYQVVQTIERLRVRERRCERRVASVGVHVGHAAREDGDAVEGHHEEVIGRIVASQKSPVETERRRDLVSAQVEGGAQSRRVVVIEGVAIQVSRPNEPVARPSGKQGEPLALRRHDGRAEVGRLERLHGGRPSRRPSRQPPRLEAPDVRQRKIEALRVTAGIGHLVHDDDAWLPGVGKDALDHLASLEVYCTWGAAVVTGGAGQAPTGRDVDLTHQVDARVQRARVVRLAIGEDKVGAVAGAELKTLGRAIWVGPLFDDDGAGLGRENDTIVLGAIGVAVGLAVIVARGRGSVDVLTFHSHERPNQAPKRITSSQRAGHRTLAGNRGIKDRVTESNARQCRVSIVGHREPEPDRPAPCNRLRPRR